MFCDTLAKQTRPSPYSSHRCPSVFNHDPTTIQEQNCSCIGIQFSVSLSELRTNTEIRSSSGGVMAKSCEPQLKQNCLVIGGGVEYVAMSVDALRYSSPSSILIVCHGSERDANLMVQLGKITPN